MNGLSRWSPPIKMKNKQGFIVYTSPTPVMCDCGHKHPIGEDGTKFASFFYDDFEWICAGCGKVMEPGSNEKEI